MTHTCCPVCRLRLDAAPASGAGDCPSCHQPLIAVPAAEALGFRLVALDPAVAAPAAQAASLPVPDGQS